MSTHIFDSFEYQNAANRALDFIKRQMNVNNWQYNFSFDKDYKKTFDGLVVYGFIEGLSSYETRVENAYIEPDHFYTYSETGTVRGTASDSGGVILMVYTDTGYEALHMPISGGAWKSIQRFRETYLVPDYDPITGEKIGEHEEIVEYTLPYEAPEGFKMFQYGRRVSSHWTDISQPEAEYEKAERLDYVVSDLVPEEQGGGGYPYFSDYVVRYYTYSDAEYLTDTCKVYYANNGKMFFFSPYNIMSGEKVFKFCYVDKTQSPVSYDVRGISGGAANIDSGRLPASFLIPTDDPQYDKDGSKALWKYGYCLNARTWAYDVGLALLVFTTSEDYELCQQMMNRMAYEQNDDGSFNFSYDIYIGQLFEGYTRTGAQGWVVWGMCYYVLTTGDYGPDDIYYDMIMKAGEWLVYKQVLDTNDIRYGLLTGGHGEYNQDDYSYKDIEIEWCSTEHQCSALQALHGCSLVARTDKEIKKFEDCAKKIKDNLYFKLYDKNNHRFFQGINSGVRDSSWALDCTSWAGDACMNVLSSFFARKSKETCVETYLVKDKTIVQSSEQEHYNQRYSSVDTFSGCKPYADSEGGYEDSPEIVWTEGSLGLANLSLKFNQSDEAKHLVDDCIKLQNCVNSTGGILYVTETYASLPWEFHTWESVVSSAWLYLIIKNPDVLFPRVLKRNEFMIKIKFAERPGIESHLSYIYIAHQPNKTEYELGEALDITGLVVKAMFSDTSSEDITDSCIITGFDPTKRTNQKLTVNYEGYKTYFYVSVAPLKVTEIQVAHQPDKVNYSQQDTVLDITGLVIQATYEDGTTGNVTSLCSYSGFDTSIGRHTITVSYSAFHSQEKTTTFFITVQQVESLSVTHLPNKTRYYPMQNLDTYGLVLTAIFQDLSTEDVTRRATYSGFDSGTIGIKTVTASYAGKNTTFNVEVVQRPPDPEPTPIIDWFE